MYVERHIGGVALNWAVVQPKQAVTVRYKRNLREYLTTMWA